MTKRERIAAVLARRPSDRPAVAFWRHVPDVDHTAQGLAEAMLAFHRRWDLDLIKVMSSGVYCVEDWGCKVAYRGSPHGARQCIEHAVTSAADWGRLRALDPGAGALGRELEAVRLIRKGRHDDAPILHTLFSPLTIARKLAGDRVRDDLRRDPAAVTAALDVIADTVVRYARASLQAGADGLFYATQTATPDFITPDESARFGSAYDRRVLQALGEASGLTLLHVHGTGIYFEAMAALPAHAVNWHDRLTPPTVAEATKRFGGALVAGLDENGTLRRGTPAAVAAQVHDAVRQSGGVGLIVAPGCVLPLDVPDAALTAVVETVKKAAA